MPEKPQTQRLCVTVPKVLVDAAQKCAPFASPSALVARGLEALITPMEKGEKPKNNEADYSSLFD